MSLSQVTVYGSEVSVVLEAASSSTEEAGMKVWGTVRVHTIRYKSRVTAPVTQAIRPLAVTRPYSTEVRNVRNVLDIRKFIRSRLGAKKNGAQVSEQSVLGRAWLALSRSDVAWSQYEGREKKRSGDRGTTMVKKRDWGRTVSGPSPSLEIRAVVRLSLSRTLQCYTSLAASTDAGSYS